MQNGKSVEMRILFYRKVGGGRGRGTQRRGKDLSTLNQI